MKQQKVILVLVLVFVLLLAGAALLYNTLSKNMETDQLATLPGQEQTTPETSVPPETTEPPETTAPAETEPEKNPAPDFTVYDGDGNAVKLSDYFGKPIVLNFWASWCGPCKSEMPDFQKVFEEMGDEVQFLMVNSTGGRETLDSAKAFIADSGYTFPVFYDTDLDASTIYGVYSLPSTYFIDGEGNAIAKATGAITESLLLKGIGMITE